jgi:hypothetical protein
MEKNIEILKQRMLSSPLERTVANWDLLREAAKFEFAHQVIYDLDASAFIHEWLNSDNNETN